MKKLLIVLVVALLAIALVACGDPADTSKDNGATTTPDNSASTNPDNGAESTPDKGNTENPVDSSSDDDDDEDPTYCDLIEDIDYMALVAAWNGIDFYTFEDTHGSLDNHIALVLNFNDVGGVYTDLFLDTTVEGATPYPNDEYDWVITLEGKDYNIERFSLYNYGTSGFVRCDLGADIKWSDFEWDENDQHEFEAELKIYDSSKTLYYYANLNYYDTTVFTKPEDKVMTADSDRPANLVQISNSQYTAMSGPNDYDGEGYDKLFDGKIITKICANADGDDGACVVKINALYSIVGMSIVNANDNKTYTGRTLVIFDVYGSNTTADPNEADGWTLVYSSTGLGNDADGNPITDKTAYSTNYGENYYAFENAADYTYYKIVPHNGEMWQVGEIIFWTEE